ncbi:MAG TPA: SusC/RagA family TonB-linked outer membrane protein [Pseudosphingobacterium sp.]|nr:SusC/RagA family TonB-linked outer membrane protein [Pseudosphingobacterium sp.]
MKYLLIIILSVCWLQGFSRQPFATIRGRVLDSENGRPVVAASVTLNEKQAATKTDENGLFSLRVKNGVPLVLSISSLDYKPIKRSFAQVVKDTIVFHLEKDEVTLEEVVVSTGYEELPLERATGSFEKVDNKLFDRQISTDVISRLDGLVSGVQFDKRSGSETDFNIRGLSSIGASTVRKPLVVVDNFPYEGDIGNLNPNDIAGITFLKDAAAASIWGAKAGNGVLVITTKKGQFEAPVSLTANANTTVTDKPNLFYAPRMSTSEYIDLEIFLFNQGYFNAALNNNTTRPVVTPVVELLEAVRKGELSEQETYQSIDNLRQQDVRRDITNHLYRQGINQQYNVRLNGGTARVNYLFSVGYDHNKASLVGNWNDRFTFRNTTSLKPLPNLDVQIGAVYTHSRLNVPNEGLAALDPASNKGLYPYARFTDDEGNPLAVEKNYRKGYIDTAGNGRLLDWSFRPLEEIQLAERRDVTQDLLFNVNASYQLLPGFKAQLLYQYEGVNTSGYNYNSEETFFTRNLINRFTQIQDDGITHAIPLGGILDESTGSLNSHSLRGMFNLDRQWGQHHQLIALLGGEIRDNKQNFSQYRTYGYKPDILTHQTVDYVNRYPIYDNLSASSYILDNTVFSGNVDRFVSVFANASYIYKGRYTFSGSARRDASNLFGVSTNNKWKPLWSSGFAWNLSEENFFRWDALPYLKLRLTYGYSGNVNNAIAALTTINYRGISRLSRLPYAIVINPPNPSLRWENVAMTNAGLDFRSKNNLFTGSLEFYVKNATDLLALVPADMTTGFNNLTRNSAKLQTKGFDLNITSRNLSGNFSWETNWLFSLNKNKVMEYLYKNTRLSSMVGSGANITPIEGQSAYNIISYRWGGLDAQTGNPKGYINGELSEDYLNITNNASMDDFVFHGSALPQVYGSIRNSFGWRQLSLSFNIQYKLDYYFRRPSVNYNILFSSGKVMHADYALRWQQPGDELITNVPSLVYPANTRRDDFYNLSEATVEKGDHIRLKDVNLSYNFKNTNLKSLPIKNIVATIYANNLGILWRANKKGLDPDFRDMPLPRTIAFGLKMDF